MKGANSSASAVVINQAGQMVARLDLRSVRSIISINRHPLANMCEQQTHTHTHTHVRAHTRTQQTLRPCSDLCDVVIPDPRSQTRSGCHSHSATLNPDPQTLLHMIANTGVQLLQHNNVTASLPHM